MTDTNDGLWFDGLNANATYTYDNRNRLTSSTIAGGATKWFAYDALGNLTGRDASGPGIQNQLYADPARPHAITQNHLGDTYAYDADGNVIRRGSEHLSYDSDGRLRCAGSSQGQCNLAVFRYDVDGTRLSETTSAGSRILMGDLFEWEVGNSHATANVMAFGRRIAFEYSWNQTLRSAWLPPGWQLPVAPRLLGPGLALGALTAALVYLLWLTAQGAAVCRPVPAALQLVVVASLLFPNPAWAGGGGATSLRRWISYDHVGNSIRYTEPGGATVKGRTFEPFGKVIAETATTEATPQLFTGQRYEPATGLYDFRARWYDPEAGRFLSVDPIVQEVSDPQTHNAYGYVRNNPVNFVDPDGLGFWKKLLGILRIIVGVVLIVAGAVALTYSSGAETSGWLQITFGVNEIIAGARMLSSNSGGGGGLENTGIPGYLSLQTAMLGAGVLKAQTTRANSFQDPAKEVSRNSDGGPQQAGLSIPIPWPVIIAGGADGPSPVVDLILLGLWLTYEAYRADQGAQILQQSGKSSGGDSAKDKQRKGRPTSNQAQNKQVRDAARETGLDRTQKEKLRREVEKLSREHGEDLGYGEIKRLADEIKSGLF